MCGYNQETKQMFSPVTNSIIFLTESGTTGEVQVKNVLIMDFLNIDGLVHPSSTRWFTMSSSLEDRIWKSEYGILQISPGALCADTVLRSDIPVI